MSKISCNWKTCRVIMDIFSACLLDISSLFTSDDIFGFLRKIVIQGIFSIFRLLNKLISLLWAPPFYFACLFEGHLMKGGISPLEEEITYGDHASWNEVFIHCLLFFFFCWSEAHLTLDKLGNRFLASKLLVSIVGLAENITDIHYLCSFLRLVIGLLLSLMESVEAALRLDLGAFIML